MPRKKWRLLNIGEIPWKRTQSIYHALALVKEELKSPNTLIINWPDRPFVCIGLHQVIDTSIEIENVKALNIPFTRRACGGGSVYLNNQQIFYQIITKETDYPSKMIDFYKISLEPAIETYKDFGIPAEFVPVNDIVANDKKISGNGSVTFNGTRVLVGNFILDFPSKNMSRILKVPNEKFRDKIATTLEERMGSFSYFLKEIPSKTEIIKKYIENFEQLLNIELVPGELFKEETNKIEEIEKLYSTEDWIYYVEKTGRERFQQKIKSGTYFTSIDRKLTGGLLSLFLHFDSRKLKDIIISGDFSLNPPFILQKIQDNLRDIDVDYDIIRAKLSQIIDENFIEIPGVEKEDIAKLIIEAFDKLKV